MKLEEILNTVIQGDCLEVMKQLPDKSIDLCLCDPPYGITDCDWDIVPNFEELWKELKRIGTDNCTYVFTASQPFTTDLINSNREAFRYEWIWEKNSGSNPLLANKQPMKTHENIVVFQKDRKEIVKDLATFIELREYSRKLRKFLKYSRKKMVDALGDTSSQHFLEPDGPQWQLCTKETYNRIEKIFNIRNWDEHKEWEDLNEIYEFGAKTLNLQMTKGEAYVAKTGKANMPHLESLQGHTTINEGTRYPRSVLRINSEKGLHPTQKPVALMAYLANTYSNQGDIILDPFLGSGTTAVAAKQLGRNYIGIEISEKYCKIANDRLRQDILI